MKQRRTSQPVHVDLIVMFILTACTVMLHTVHAANEGSGTVVVVRGNTIIIELAEGSTAAVGDTAELSFELGGEQFTIGTWRVTRLMGPVVEAARVKADLDPEKGMKVRFAVAENNSESVVETDTPPPASPPAKEDELFWLKDKAKSAARTPAVTPVTPSDKPVRTMPTSAYRLVWNDSGSGARRDFAVFRPMSQAGYYPLGDVAVAEPWPGRRYAAPGFNTILVADGTTKVQPPTGYRLVWTSEGSLSDKPFSSWAPVPPAGYKCLGDVGSPAVETMPSTDAIRCLPEQCVIETRLNEKIWDDTGSGARLDFSAWLITQANTYVGTASHSKPRGTFYTISPDCL